jgi:hypothetical protein
MTSEYLGDWPYRYGQLGGPVVIAAAARRADDNPRAEQVKELLQLWCQTPIWVWDDSGERW